MKFQIRHIVIGCMAALFGAGMSSCSDDTISSTVDGSGTTVKLNVGIPQFDETTLTRMGVCDPDGETVKRINLICFDSDGFFIGKVQSNYTITDETKAGTLTATIPANTCRMHVLANVNVTNIDDDHYNGLNENTLMASLYSGQGLDNFWGYYRAENPADFKKYVEDDNNTITLIRNQAQVSAEDVSATKETNPYKIIGIAVCNMNAFGTVVPMDRTKITSDPFTLTDYNNTPLTLLTDDKNEKADNPKDVEAVAEGDEAVYNIFENKNSQDDPVAVILKVSHNSSTKYHKILLMNQDGTFFELHRNHRYNIKISALNDAGYDTFEDAVNGTAANNYLITIEDIVPSLNYAGYNLSITDGTSQIYNTGGTKTIDFYCKNDQKTLSASDFTASWGTNNGIAESATSISYDGTTGKGTITITLNNPGTTMQEGLLYIGVKNTILKKSIHIYSISSMGLNLRVSQHVDDAQNIPVVVSFVIPNDFPTNLLPLTFKISTNRYDADPNHNTLQVINETTPDGSWNYKYIYKATQVGPQRVYFKTIDSGYGNGGNGSKNTTVYLEDEKKYFTTANTNFGFAKTNYIITLSGTGEDNSYSQDALSFNDQIPTKNKTIVIHYKATVTGKLEISTKNFTLTDADAGTPATSNGIKTYSINNCAKERTFTFKSDYARYDDIIWFQSDANQTASAVIHTQANCGVTVTSTKNPNYGKGEPVSLDITFPVYDGSISYTILTKNLTAVANQGLTLLPGTGYKYTPNSPTATLKFTTNKVVVHENIKVVASDENALDISLIPGSCTIDNAPISGTMTSTNGFNSNNFAYIEDASGNRIGSITMTGTGTTRNYTLRLYSYYTLSMTEQVKIHITDPNKVDRFVATTIGTLISNGDITLN